jgi:hypothetical protein
MRYEFQNPLLERSQFEIFQYISEIENDFLTQNMIAEQFERTPHVITSFIANYYLPNDDKIKHFINHYLNNNLITIIAGARNQGKTVWFKWFAKMMPQYEVFYINPDFKLPKTWSEITYNLKMPYFEILKYLYPEVANMKKFTDVIDYIRSIPPENKSKKMIILAHDEVHKDVPKSVGKEEGELARNMWAELRKICKSFHLFFTSQTLSGIPIQLFNYADVQIYKPFNFFQQSSDRKQIMGDIGHFLPRNKAGTLVITDQYTYFENPMVI